MTPFREFPLWHIAEIPQQQPHKYFCALFLRWHLMIRMHTLVHARKHTHIHSCWGVSHTQQVWLRWPADHVFQVLARLQPLPSINRSIGVLRKQQSNQWFIALPMSVKLKQAATPCRTTVWCCDNCIWHTQTIWGEKRYPSSYHLKIQNNKEIKEFLAIWTLLQLCNYTFSER